MESTFSLGDKLRQLRSERNISQRDLANLAGLSSNSISSRSHPGREAAERGRLSIQDTNLFIVCREGLNM
jgi:transcriptional regulator with XRE-family HTH domain